jgi:hypothetical protein
MCEADLDSAVLTTKE